jgi:hypothetical protein
MEIGLKGNIAENCLRYSFCSSSYSVAELQKVFVVLISSKHQVFSHQRLMYNNHVNDEKLIAHFMSASAPLERYLQQGKPLTALQLESISLTIDGLFTYLDTWKRKHG